MQKGPPYRRVFLFEYNQLVYADSQVIEYEEAYYLPDYEDAA